jgi:hypothetical protein
MWSSGQSSWVQIKRSRVRFPALDLGTLSLVSTIEELLGRNSSGPGVEIREYGSGDPLRRPCDTLSPQNLALTSPTSCGRSVGIVRLRTKATEFFCLMKSARVVETLLGRDDVSHWLKALHHGHVLNIIGIRAEAQLERLHVYMSSER